MAFPDRIERTFHLAHPPQRVWAALTTAEGLGTWFAQLPDTEHKTAFGGNTDGWTSELGELVAYLDGRNGHG